MHLCALNAAHTRQEAVRIEEVAHNVPEIARISACPEMSRTAARAEVARIAGCRDLIRSRDQQEAVRRRQAPDRIAHKTRRESQQSRQIRK